MMENDSVPFIARLRKAGASGASLLITIPKDVVDLLELEDGQICELRIKRVKKGEVFTFTDLSRYIYQKTIMIIRRFIINYCFLGKMRMVYRFEIKHDKSTTLEIPKEIREKLKLKEGDLVRFTVEKVYVGEDVKI